MEVKNEAREVLNAKLKIFTLYAEGRFWVGQWREESLVTESERCRQGRKVRKP